jgi:hypothetical protein
MNPEEPMSIDERRKYLHKLQDRCWQALCQERSRMLDEIEQVTGLHRKSLIRLLRGDLRRQPPGPPAGADLHAGHPE